MEKEICDYYEPKIKKYTNKLCKYFIGDRDNKNHIDKCRRYCSIMESSECMQERSYRRNRHGALEQR